MQVGRNKVNLKRPYLKLTLYSPFTAHQGLLEHRVYCAAKKRHLKTQGALQSILLSKGNQSVFLRHEGHKAESEDFKRNEGFACQLAMIHR